MYAIRELTTDEWFYRLNTKWQPVFSSEQLAIFDSEELAQEQIAQLNMQNVEIVWLRIQEKYSDE